MLSAKGALAFNAKAFPILQYSDEDIGCKNISDANSFIPKSLIKALASFIMMLPFPDLALGKEDTNMPKRKGAHLTYDDRCMIEDMLKHGSSFREISRRLNVSPTTISNEVQRNRVKRLPPHISYDRSRRCIHYWECDKRGVCGSCDTPQKQCKTCTYEDCYGHCKQFEYKYCPRLKRAPYVCNTCPRMSFCELGKTHYFAREAQRAHEMRASSTHAGITCKPDDLKAMVDKVRHLLEQGHSLEAIWAVHGKELPVSVRTFYSYMDKGVMGLANMELPKKIRYKHRKSKKGEPRMELFGRCYRDWQNLTDEERMLTVQMDTIEGTRRDRKAVLSLHFPRLMFQIYVLLPSKTQASVIAALDAIETYCDGAFADVFGVILTDRGSEFLDFKGIEGSALGKFSRCRVFYCDPMKPAQKGACEKNTTDQKP